MTGKKYGVLWNFFSFKAKMTKNPTWQKLKLNGLFNLVQFFFKFNSNFENGAYVSKVFVTKCGAMVLVV